MDAADVARYITGTFAGVDVLEDSGDSYFYYDPERSIPHDRRMPFATLMTGDRYDSASQLDRPGVYRLNIGVGKETYTGLFGPPPHTSVTGDVIVTGHDFAAPGVLMPHPVYAPLSWVCIVSPSAEQFEAVKPLLAEAHARDAAKHARRASPSDE